MNRGASAEAQAHSYLEREGLRPIERNYRCRLGEIDLIMRDGATLVFVEVRQRAKGSLVSAAESVSHTKQRKLVAAARHFLMRNPAYSDHAMRFDLVAIDGDQPRWQRNVMQIDG